MVLGAPATGMAIATSAARPSSALESGGSGGVNGSPGTTPDVEKHFRRRGFSIEEISPEKLPDVSNQARDVAFRVTSGTLDGKVKASHTIGVFAASDATIRAGSHFDGGGRAFQFEDESDGSEVRGFELDVSRGGAGVKLFQSSRGFTARDVTVHGVSESAHGKKWGCGGAYVTVPRGETVTLKNVNLPDGATRTAGIPSHHDSIGVILNGVGSDGLLRIENCNLSSYPNNLIYASGPRKQGFDGRAIIENCELSGSDRAQARIGNNSVVRNNDIYVDTLRDGFNNGRGVWARYARGVTIEDNTIRTHHSDPGEAVRIDSTAAKTTVRNNDIELRSSHRAARGVCAYSPGEEARDAGADIVVEGNRFHGGGSPRDVLLVKQGRGGSTIRDNDIDVPAAGQEIDIRR